MRQPLTAIGTPPVAVASGGEGVPPGPGRGIEDYIVLIHDALPAAFCGALLSEFGASDDWRATSVTSGQVNLAVRNAQAITISNRSVIGRNPPVRQDLDHALFKYCGAVVLQYNRHFAHCRVTRDSGFELLRYQVGGFYREHADSDHTVSRVLACSFLLNDDYCGGEFAFFAGTKVVSMRRGDAIVFPANFMYPHQIMPVTSGTRYAVVTWFV